MVQACGVGEAAGEDGVGEEALAVGEAAEVPVSVCFLVVGDAPVAAADVDALGGVLVFGLVVHVDALAGFEVRVSAGGVHDLVDPVDEVLHVRAGAAGGAVPRAGAGDEFVERLLLGGEALRVGLPDVAEGDLGVGEAAGQVFLDLEDAAFEAQWCGEAGVDDLHAVAYVRAFRVVSGLAECGHVGGVGDDGRGAGLERVLGEGEEFLGVFAVGEVHACLAVVSGAVGSHDAPVGERLVVLDVGFAVVDVGEADFAAVAAGGLALVVGLFDAFAPAVEAGDDVAAVDVAFDLGEVLAVFEAFRGVGGAPVFDEVDDAPADPVAGRVGLVFGLDFEPVGVGGLLDGFEDGAVVEGEVGRAGDGAGLDGADRPPGAFQCLGEAGFGVRVAVAFVLDIGAREFRDAAGAVGDGDGHACGAGGLGGLAQVFRPAAHRVLEDDAFVLVDLADGGDIKGVGAVGGSGADGFDGVGQVAERVAPAVEDHVTQNVSPR